MRKVLEKCPSCAGELHVTQMNCTACETVVSARYETCSFCKLPPESLEFLEIFIKNRGNIKEMERELDVSYWAIRARLNDVITELGFESATDDKPTADDSPQESVSSQRSKAASRSRKEVLKQLEQGKLSAMEATKLLNSLK